MGTPEILVFATLAGTLGVVFLGSACAVLIAKYMQRSNARYRGKQKKQPASVNRDDTEAAPAYQELDELAQTRLTVPPPTVTTQSRAVQTTQIITPNTTDPTHVNLILDIAGHSFGTNDTTPLPPLDSLRTPTTGATSPPGGCTVHTSYGGTYAVAGSGHSSTTVVNPEGDHHYHYHYHFKFDQQDDHQGGDGHRA
jgi:hypothetical protein